MKISTTIRRIINKHKLRRERIELIDRKNNLLRMGFPVEFDYGSPIDDRLSEIEKELSEQ